MADITLREIKSDPVIQERVSLKTPQVKKEEKIYEVEKKELSSTIQKFDRKVAVHRNNPYNFTEVSKNIQKKSIGTTQTASEMIANKTYNTIGKVLGVDTIHEWNKYYDKVFVIAEWAKKNIGDDLDKLVRFLTQKSRSIPSLGAKRIDDMYIHARMKLKL